jgi:hypothetical protein
MNTQYTDNQLNQALAKMLPKLISWHDEGYTEQNDPELYWICTDNSATYIREVLNTELLHLCWLVEKSLDDEQVLDYNRTLLEDVLQCFSQGRFRQHFALTHASWQQKVQALAQVKGVYLSKEIAVKQFVPL